MARPSRRRLSDAEREQRRQADRERLEQAARELLSSAGWARWMRVRATNGLARYSLRNQLLIAADCYQRGITPTYVAGFRAFLQLNRCVRKGETAIRILAPMSVTEQARQGAGNDDKTEEPRRRVFFRTVPVFDVAMTDPLPGTQPVPLEAPRQPITGDSHRQLLEPLRRLADELGYSIEVRELPESGPGGWCDPKARQIVIADGPGNRIVRTLVHELAHALGVGYEQYGRERAEVLVDSVTYVVLGSVGLDVGGESIPYVAGWGEDGALEAIRAYAQTINELAARIENAIAAPAPAPADAPGELTAAPS